MIKCLQHFNFGESLIKWVKLFYNDITSIVINNGYFSDAFNINRGVRQGCPLSSSLFIICIEILSNYIQKENSIKGIIINNVEIKQTLFADDATFMTDGSEQSFEKLVNVVSNFECVSGLKLNTNKTNILRIGSLKCTNIKYSQNKPFKWTSESAQTLGMIFSNDKEQNLKLNLMPKIDNFNNCLKQWQHRKLTLLGKVTVLKTFAIPKLIYPLTVLPNPSKQIIQNITTQMFKFLWSNKPDKIKRDIIVLDYTLGGIRMTNLNYFINALKGCWIKRLIDKNNNGHWKIFYKSILEKKGGALVFQCNVSESDVK